MALPAAAAAAPGGGAGLVKFLRRYRAVFPAARASVEEGQRPPRMIGADQEEPAADELPEGPDKAVFERDGESQPAHLPQSGLQEPVPQDNPVSQISALDHARRRNAGPGSLPYQNNHILQPMPINNDESFQPVPPMPVFLRGQILQPGAAASSLQADQPVYMMPAQPRYAGRPLDAPRSLSAARYDSDSDSESDSEDLYRPGRGRLAERDDLPAAGVSDDDADTDLEEEVVRVPAVPPARKKAAPVQRVDEAWVKAGLLRLVGRGRQRAHLRRDVRDKVTTEELSGALRPVFATNFTARFTAVTCDTLHEFRQGVQERLDRACWYCDEVAPSAETIVLRAAAPSAPAVTTAAPPRAKCMQICQVSRLDVACKRRGDERFLRVVGLADPVEGRRFRAACNDTCMEEWELLLQYGAAARLRDSLAAPDAAVGRSHVIAPSVAVSPVTRCAERFELRYRLCYPAGSWAQRAIIDLEHTPAGLLAAGAIGALLLLCCLGACCYYRVLQIPRVAAFINARLRRWRLRWRVAGGVERTESGHYRRPSMVATGAHGKKSRDEIRRTVQRWRKQRAAEGRHDGAPRTIYSAVQMLHPPRASMASVTAAEDAAQPFGDDTSVFSEQIDTDNSG